MEEKAIGLFIRDRRLELGLTQQQLADKLGITDKAVSKWERCVSCPDITLLRALADALEVSVTELLAGQRDLAPPPVPPEVENVVLDTVRYAETARRQKSGWRFWTFLALSAGCLTAVLVLFIIYITSGFSGGILDAVKCVAFGWALCYPLLRAEQHPVRSCLVLFSAAVVPFLWTLLPFAVFSWAAWIVLLGTAYLWAVYFLCRRLRQRVWLAAGGSFLLGLPLSLCISAILESRGVEGNAVSFLACAITAGVCFLMDSTQTYLRQKKNKQAA